MSAETAEQVAKALEVRLPIHPRQIIRYTMGKPLDFTPGTAYVYSNFGYCVLGRVIEAVTRKPYHEFVSERILAPLGIREMRLGKNLLKDRAPGEVRYYDSKRRTGRAISGPEIGKQAPLPYGVECIETMDANGGWIASVVDLLRFAVAFDDPKKCPVLKEESILTMLAPPPGPVGHGPAGQAQRTLLRLWLGRAAGWRTTRQVHQVSYGWAGGKFHAPGLPRRRHQLGRALQQRRRQGRKGLRRSDRSTSAQAGGRDQELARHRYVPEILMPQTGCSLTFVRVCRPIGKPKRRNGGRAVGNQDYERFSFRAFRFRLARHSSFLGFTFAC